MAFTQIFSVALVALSLVQVVLSEGSISVKGARSSYFSPGYVPPAVSTPYVSPYTRPYVAPVSPYVAPYTRPYGAPYNRPYVAPVSPYVAPYNRPYVAPYNRAYVAPYNRAYVAPAVSPYYDSYNSRTTYDNYADRRAPAFAYQSGYSARSGYVPPAVTSSIYNRYSAGYAKPYGTSEYYRHRQTYAGAIPYNAYGSGVKSISG